jgi:hypothetical protein
MRLKRASSREDALDALQKIREQLLKGTFPR